MNIPRFLSAVILCGSASASTVSADILVEIQNSGGAFGDQQFFSSSAAGGPTSPILSVTKSATDWRL